MPGPRNRAPLGFKTTNAKAKVFQTPASPGGDNKLDKRNQNTLSARKPKPKAVPAELIKVEVLGDKDELGEPEIEYMPPRAKSALPLVMEEYTVTDTKQTFPIIPMIFTNSIFPYSQTVA